jgi:hypothetical protein
MIVRHRIYEVFLFFRYLLIIFLLIATLSCSNTGSPSILPETGSSKAAQSQEVNTSVAKPAEFHLGSLTVSPQEIVQGKELVISIDISNTGGVEGTYTCNLMVSSVKVQTKDVAISPGITQNIKFFFTPNTLGPIDVTIEELSKTITILKPAYFKLTNIQVPAAVEFGSPGLVTISATLSNEGEVEGSYKSGLLVNGREIETKEVILQGGKTQVVTFGFTPDKAGPVQVQINNLSAIVKVTPSKPVMVSPVIGAVLDNGRTDSKDNIVWDFDWNDIPGVNMYELYVIGANALYPVINTQISSSSYHSARTGYIASQNCYGWTWKVRASAGGLWSDWSEVRLFDVEPVNSDPPTPSSTSVPTSTTSPTVTAKVVKVYTSPG